MTAGKDNRGLKSRSWPALIALAIASYSSSFASANAPPGRYAITETTVLDKRTGLTWQRVSGPLTYQDDAISYCDGLELGTYRDWRVPNMAELLSIVDVTRFNPAIDSNAFPDTPSEPFVSSSPFPPVGRCVDFEAGAAGGCTEFTPDGLAHVRCVR
jgi:hypothetical protein